MNVYVIHYPVYVQEARIYSIRLGGNAAAPLATAEATFDIATDGTYVYYATYSDVYRVKAQ